MIDESPVAETLSSVDQVRLISVSVFEMTEIGPICDGTYLIVAPIVFKGDQSVLVP